MMHDTVKLTQSMHVEKLQNLDDNSVDQSSFISQRPRGAYNSSVCRPDLTFIFSRASQVVNVDKTDARRINNFIFLAKVDSPSSLSFVPINVDCCLISFFADVSFACNVEHTSQLGYVIALAENANRTNIVHWSSFKEKGVTRSVLSAKFFTVIHPLQFSSTLRKTLKDIFECAVSMKIYTNSNICMIPLQALGLQPRRYF